ncbi:MAG: PTS sugar transporter subunit IIA [Acidobacteria bacterium]|nr:PTS sugar transporter subunit IIA [Acidobacteriota bacterium]
MNILILSHGKLADELLAAGRAITGELARSRALCFDWSQGKEEIKTRLGEALAEIGDDEGVLILADVWGGTPCNAALSFRRPGEVEVLGGVNLPMVIRLGCLVGKELPFADAVRWLRDKGRDSIRCSEDPSPRPCVAVKDPCAEPAS